jgi:hypothetical protein
VAFRFEWLFGTLRFSVGSACQVLGPKFCVRVGFYIVWFLICYTKFLGRNLPLNGFLRSPFQCCMRSMRWDLSVRVSMCCVIYFSERSCSCVLHASSFVRVFLACAFLGSVYVIHMFISSPFVLLISGKVLNHPLKQDQTSCFMLGV